MTITTDLVIGMAGSGGDGIVSAGESLIAAAAEEGYHALMTKSFGSQIRGGESSCRVRLSTGEVLNPGGALDVAVALNWEDFVKFGAELPVSGSTVIIYESATGIAPDELPLGGVRPAEVFAVPIVPCVTFGEEEAQVKAQKARMKTLQSLGHDPSNLLAAVDLARAYGTELHTGVFYRNPRPPPTLDALVRERKELLAGDALPRERILDLFLQR